MQVIGFNLNPLEEKPVLFTTEFLKDIFLGFHVELEPDRTTHTICYLTFQSLSFYPSLKTFSFILAISLCTKHKITKMIVLMKF